MTKRTNYTLWVIQALLALGFLFSGTMKLVLPIAAMTKEISLPGAFLRFIGVAEILGGLGQVLPGIFRLWRFLTPVAASGLVIIMTGATILTLTTGGGAAAMAPFVTGVLAALVVYHRRAWALREARVGAAAQAVPGANHAH